jgi:hypothetical protein
MKILCTKQIVMKKSFTELSELKAQNLQSIIDAIVVESIFRLFVFVLGSG